MNLFTRNKLGHCIHYDKLNIHTSHGDISLQILEGHFRTTFEGGDDNPVSDIREHSKREVDEKYDSVLTTLPRDKVVSQSMVKRYIDALNMGCSPGVDGIMTEHLKHSSDSQIPLILSGVLTLHTVPLSSSIILSGPTGSIVEETDPRSLPAT